jgi:membrane-bound lytic murein transglycosylase A
VGELHDRTLEAELASLQRRLSWWRAATIVLLVGGGVLGGLWLRGLEHVVVAPAETMPAGPEAAPPPPEPALVLERAQWAELPGWEGEDHAAALDVFARVCRTLERQPTDKPFEPAILGLTAGDWARACVSRPRSATATAARAWFEATFDPWSMGNAAVEEARRFEGFYTGYYEPTLVGSRTRRPGFETPLHRRPPELVSVDLGLFREGWKGERTAGFVKNGALFPFSSRSEIEQGALRGRGLELVWVNDPVDAFFLHIQGSGRVRLLGGGEMRVGYDGQNGHPYLAIGRELIDRGELTREEVSMQSIRAWLDAHPDEAPGVLRRNASYVFFRKLEGEGPLGSLGVPLVPGRSLAVDRRFVALGVPIFLDLAIPAAEHGGPDEVTQRLMVAMDTGGAIRGPVRGDVFWGPGDEAAERAGRMKHPGRAWLLAPRPATSAAQQGET